MHIYYNIWVPTVPRLEQRDEGVRAVLDGAGLPDGRGQTGDADLDQALVVVVRQEVGLGRNKKKKKKKNRSAR